MIDTTRRTTHHAPRTTHSETADAVLRTEDLVIGYRHPGRADSVVAAGLNLELRRGELVCLLGPNGAGKSTLMRTLAALQPSLSGAIWLDGDAPSALSARELARRLSIVLTERVDVGNLAARELVALGRHPYTDWWGNLTPQDAEIVRWAIQAVGAVPLADRPVQELSDGERQKIMIARALAQEPQLILLDEPTAFLDLPRRVEVMGLLRSLARQTGRAILLSTHDLDLALRGADRLWLLSAEGEYCTGAPEDLVLNGAFERVFASAGVTFDAYAGSFRVAREAAGVVQLCGDGMAALWTIRALEREGFCIEQISADPLGVGRSAKPIGKASVASISIQPEQPHWRLDISGNAENHTSIYDLIASLRSRIGD
jgi:iron complex transport system ATP-binding protein